MANTVGAPTYQELFDLGRAEAALKRPELTFDEGDISEMLVAGGAAMGDHVAQFAANRFQATTVDGAQGDDLAVIADDRWSIQKRDATFAKGKVTLSRTNGNGAPAGTVAAGTTVATDRDAQGNDVRFTIDIDQDYALGDIADRAVDATAAVAGPTGDVSPGAITRLVDDVFDTTFKVKAGASTQFAGGNPEESDPELREEIRQFPNSLRRAVLDAIETGAKQVDGVAVAIATEETFTNNPPPGFNIGDPTGIVDLYVADENGNHSDAMVAAVRAILPQWRAAGAIVNVYGGNRTSVAINLTMVLAQPLPTATKLQLQGLVAQAVVTEVNKLRTGEGFWHAQIIRAGCDVNPLVIKSLVVNSPGADPYLPANKYDTLRIATTDISFI